MLAAVERDPAAALLETARRVFVVAVGKAAPEMAAAVRLRVRQERFGGGICVAGVPGLRIPGFRCLEGDHPLPGPRSLRAGLAVRAFLAGCRPRPDDLVVFAVSGGTSALVAAPVSPLLPEDLWILTEALLRSGLDVTTMNGLRALLSRTHGGALLELVGQASVLGLILCDNVQVGAEAVGSGLSFPPRPDLRTADETLAAVAVPDEMRKRVREALAWQRAGGTPPVPPVNVVVGNPGMAARLCGARAEDAGYRVIDMGGEVQGEAKEVAADWGRLVRQYHSGRPTCIIGAGEVTVSVKGRGRGGRCQELAWAMAAELKSLPAAAFVALATDGRDYLPDVMGAYVTGDTVDRAAGLGFAWRSVLEQNDANSPLSALGQCLQGRETGTNVCDLYLAGVGAPHGD